MGLEQFGRLRHLSKESRDLSLAAVKILGVPASSQETNARVKDIFEKHDIARFISLIPLIEPEAQTLPYSERKGLLCFASFILQADNILDETPHIKSTTSAQNLKIALLSCYSQYTDCTLGELLSTTIDYFTGPKQDIVEGCLGQMLDLCFSNRIGPAGSYDFHKAEEYKRATDDLCVGKVYAIAGVYNQALIDRMKTIAMLAQFRDDQRDWAVDWQQSTLNMFIGLTYDTDHKEFHQLDEFIRKYPESLSNCSAAKAWARKYAPISNRRYNELYFQETDKLDSILLSLILKAKQRLDVSIRSHASVLELITKPS